MNLNHSIEEAASPACFQVLDYALLPGFHLEPGNTISSPDDACGPAPRFSTPSSPNFGAQLPEFGRLLPELGLQLPEFERQLPEFSRAARP